MIDGDPNDSRLQQLRFCVDTDHDGDYSDETTLLSRSDVDDVWSPGYFGLYRASGGSSIQQYDNVKIGYDNNDAGDDVQIDDDFSSNAMLLEWACLKERKR